MVEILLLLDGSSLVFLEFGIEMAAPHFEAQLSPRPHISHISHLYEVLKGLGLDSPDLSLADTPQVEVTQSFVRALVRPRDLRVVRDDPVPARS
mgnify:CR=1 FL=1